MGIPSYGREDEDAALEEAGRLLSEALAAAPGGIRAGGAGAIHVHIHIQTMTGNLYTTPPTA
jgi:hypothetical protein